MCIIMKKSGQGLSVSPQAQAHMYSTTEWGLKFKARLP